MSLLLSNRRSSCRPMLFSVYDSWTGYQVHVLICRNMGTGLYMGCLKLYKHMLLPFLCRSIILTKASTTMLTAFVSISPNQALLFALFQMLKRLQMSKSPKTTILEGVFHLNTCLTVAPLLPWNCLVSSQMKKSNRQVSIVHDKTLAWCLNQLPPLGIPGLRKLPREHTKQNKLYTCVPYVLLVWSEISFAW